MIDYSGWMTADEVAALFGVTRRTVYNWKSEGRIGCAKMGNRLYFDPLDVERAARRTRAAGRLQAAPRKGTCSFTDEDAAALQAARDAAAEHGRLADEMEARMSGMPRGTAAAARAYVEAFGEAVGERSKALAAASDVLWLRSKARLADLVEDARAGDAGAAARAEEAALDLLEGPDGRDVGRAAWLEAAAGEARALASDNRR